MYRSFYLRGLVTHAENDFLQLASEVGLIGIVLLIALFVVLFVIAVSRIRSLDPGDPQRLVRVAGLIGILALMFHSLVERNVQVPANAFLYTVIWALVLRTSRERLPLGDRRKQAVRKIHKAVAIIPNEGSLPS
jgi:O-antigen ligase